MAHLDERGETAPARSKTAKKLNGGKHRDVQLIRHGATKLNNDDVSVDRIRGWKDIPLSEEGRKEANNLGKKVSGNPPDALLSSDLCRAQETAEIVSEHCGVKLQKPSKDFRPWNVGDLVGKKSKEAIPILAQYAVDKPDEPVPGGESFNSFRTRLLTGLAKALAEHDGVVAVVTHHRVERLLKAWAKAGFPRDGEIDKAEFNRKGEPTGHCEILQIPVNRLKAAK